MQNNKNQYELYEKLINGFSSMSPMQYVDCYVKYKKANINYSFDHLLNQWVLVLIECGDVILSIYKDTLNEIFEECFIYLSERVRRCTGRTTKLIDKYIDEIFKKAYINLEKNFTIDFFDHFNTETQKRVVLNKVINRLISEHEFVKKETGNYSRYDGKNQIFIDYENNKINFLFW